MVADPKTGGAWSASGNYATTFLLSRGRRLSALRVFHPSTGSHDPGVIGAHYRRLGAYLSRMEQRGRLPQGMVGFRYLPRALDVDGREVPALEMRYVDGDRVDNFAYEAIRRGGNAPSALLSTANGFRRTMRQLGRIGVAHGDLHPGNIRMSPRGIELIDYDAMYAPPLAGLKTSEIGSPDYQHPAYHAPSGPRRPYDGAMDHFSSLTIYLSLRALAKDPTLWSRHHIDSKGWGMLFTGPRDFANPARSQLFAELRRSPDHQVRYLANALYHYVQRPPGETPSLERLLVKAGY